MPKRTLTPREQAARALCRVQGHAEDIRFEGAPMWTSFLDEVDAVLEAAFDSAEWSRIRKLNSDDPR